MRESAAIETEAACERSQISLIDLTEETIDSDLRDVARQPAAFEQNCETGHSADLPVHYMLCLACCRGCSMAQFCSNTCS